MHKCLLCDSKSSELYVQVKRREYFLCNQCGLIYVPPSQHVSVVAEKKHYDQHENTPYDLNYRKFLSRLSDPLSKRVDPPAIGLDFGSGSGSALPPLLEEEGYSLELFDIFYHPNEEVFQKRYAFITATEVFEHLKAPLFEVRRLWEVLEPGGYLGVMTSRLESLNATGPRQEFASWHYIRDPTHICFWSESSFNYLANRLGAVELEFISQDVVFIKKPI